MTYEPPRISDYGDLLDITAASGAVGNEDGAGKSVELFIDPVGQVTLQLLP